MSWPRAIAGWFALVVMMILNGITREGLLQPVLDPLHSHQLSSVTGIAIILAASWWLVPWIGARSGGEQLSLGVTWLAWTVAFEFSFGHWVAGHSWRDLVADYDVSAGRLWLLVLIATALAPWLIGRVRALRAA